MWLRLRDQKPRNGARVRTKIDDEKGCRNEQELVYKDGRWWHTDMKSYIYYEPTHWSPL